MEKLIELLNEYEGKNYWRVGERRQIGGKSEITKKICCDYIEEAEEVVIAYLISKSYGFIKRLVENDKIDWLSFTECPIVYKGGKEGFYSDYEKLLMLLSISDTPIDFLCEIIKN